MAGPALIDLEWPAGLPLRRAVSAAWNRALLRVLRQLCLSTPEGSGLVVETGPSGTTIRTSRKIPETRWYLADAGVPAANGGIWGSALAWPEVVTVSGTDRASSYPTADATTRDRIYNKATAAVPTNSVCICEDVGGDLIVLGWYC